MRRDLEVGCTFCSGQCTFSWALGLLVLWVGPHLDAHQMGWSHVCEEMRYCSVLHSWCSRDLGSIWLFGGTHSLTYGVSIGNAGRRSGCPSPLVLEKLS